MMRIPTMIINLTGISTEGIQEGGSADVARDSMVGLDTDYPFHYLGIQNCVKGRIEMTGRELIKWIQDNHAEDLPVHIRNTGGADIPIKEPKLKSSIVEGKSGQTEWAKYFMI